MTIEEKAKAYDKALERARRLNVDNMLSNEAIEEIFPEVADSEDERIRKELVAFFKGMQDSPWHEKYWHDLEIDRILAYLERQKEPEQEPFSCGRENGAKWSEEDETHLKSIISTNFQGLYKNILSKLNKMFDEEYAERKIGEKGNE